MGHQRLGKLPAFRQLPDIVKYLVMGGTPTADLVDHVTDIAQRALKAALHDPVFTDALWLLIRIPQATRSADFQGGLRELGLSVVPAFSLPDILVAYDAALENAQRRSNAHATDLGEMARCAGIAALGSAIRERLPSLWPPTHEDVRVSLSTLEGPEQFAIMAHRYYSNFTERVIRYYVDRNLHHMVGVDRVAGSVNDLRSFNQAISRHCDESALIMRAFARDWLGKNYFKEGKQISRADVLRFSKYTVEKIRIELDQRKGTS